ncbi:MAG: calcium/sodium antiporter [Rhodothermales bacterium]
MLTALYMILGLGLLVAGAEGLVRGASRLASAMGIPSLIIGLTVVAFGTSAPEMVVSILSSVSGQGDIAVGNVVGSNIFNVLFILGASALVAPLVVSSQLVKLDVPVMIVLSVATLVVAWDGAIDRFEGALFVASLVAYTLFLAQKGRAETAAAVCPGSTSDPMDDIVREPAHPLRNTLFVLVGLGMLVLGARMFVTGAVTVAQWMGVDELVIGLTIVAAGTSLPEVATSIVATLRGERDIAVGNVVGSNIFNILAVLGVSSLVAAEGLGVSATALRVDLPVMVVTAMACLPIFFSGYVISRREGFLFLAGYVAYLLYYIIP